MSDDAIILDDKVKEDDQVELGQMVFLTESILIQIIKNGPKSWKRPNYDDRMIMGFWGIRIFYLCKMRLVCRKANRLVKNVLMKNHILFNKTKDGTEIKFDEDEKKLFSGIENLSYHGTFDDNFYEFLERATSAKRLFINLNSRLRNTFLHFDTISDTLTDLTLICETFDGSNVPIVWPKHLDRLSVKTKSTKQINSKNLPNWPDTVQHLNLKIYNLASDEGSIQLPKNLKTFSTCASSLVNFSFREGLEKLFIDVHHGCIANETYLIRSGLPSSLIKIAIVNYLVEIVLPSVFTQEFLPICLLIKTNQRNPLPKLRYLENVVVFRYDEINGNKVHYQVWPNELYRLKISNRYHTLEYDIDYCTTLVHLHLIYDETNNQNIDLRNHFPNVESLVIEGHYCGRLILGDVLQSLDLSFIVSRVFECPTILPYGLKKFYACATFRIYNTMLPESLKYLSMIVHFNQRIDVSLLPRNLERLIVRIQDGPKSVELDYDILIEGIFPPDLIYMLLPKKTYHVKHDAPANIRVVRSKKSLSEHVLNKTRRHGYVKHLTNDVKPCFGKICSWY